MTSLLLVLFSWTLSTSVMASVLALYILVDEMAVKRTKRRVEVILTGSIRPAPITNQTYRMTHSQIFKSALRGVYYY
jgi:hypothetical protein